jgi:multicomponent K+:H+ antiporter subunit G
MDVFAEYLIAGLLVLAGIFGLVGSYGLLKLPDTMTRLHAPTKASSLGVGGVLLASMAYAWFFMDKLSWHELLITIFVFLTAPITANFIAKAHLHRSQIQSDLPPTGTDTGWATFEPEHETVEPASGMVRGPGTD